MYVLMLCTTSGHHDTMTAMILCPVSDSQCCPIIICRFNLQGEIPWRKIYAAIGATLFVISDTVLAINKFCSPVAGERYIVMVTYFAAQLLIALSVVNSGVAVSTSVAIGDQKNRNTNIHSNGLTVNHKNSETCSKSNDVMHNSHMDNDLIKMTSSPS